MAGDVEAFERLYLAHCARIHSLARRLLGESEADDATQEVFLRAWRRLHTFRGDAAFGSWLYRLGLRRLLDLGKRMQALRERQSDMARRRRHTQEPREAAIDCEAALLRLPRGARQILVLHDVEGHTHREIAELLGVTVGTSKSQLHRARALLRGLLAEDRGVRA